MDFLSLAGRGVARFWRTAPNATRWMVVGVLAAVVIVGGALAHFHSRDDYEVLFDGEELSPQELTAMEAAFGKARLSGSRIVEGRPRVPRDKKDVYLKALDEQGALPASFYSHAERVLTQDTPWHTQKQRDALWKLAKERELALMLRKMTGIAEVSVQYEETETATFPRRRERRATVAARATAGRPLDESKIRAIRRTVMNSVGVADAQAVTVLDLNAGLAYAGEDDDATAPAASATDHDYGTAKRRFEESYTEKIRQRLAMYPGIVVAVNVELDASGQVPRQVTASIGIPHSCLATTWRRRHGQSLSSAEIAPDSLPWRRFEEETRRSVEAAVVPLLPPRSPTLDDVHLVTVETFADTSESASRVAAKPGALPLWWRDHATNIAGVLAGLVAIVWLRNALRSTSAQPRRDEDMSPTATQAAHAPSDDQQATPPLGAPPSRGDLRQKLAQRIQENPNAAAKTLRQWLATR